MASTYEFGHDGGLTAFKIKDHCYDVVEFTIIKYLDDKRGKRNINSRCTTFFTKQEFKQFFTPLINDLKVRFDNEDNTSEPNT
jgi:hypothetical protein